MNRKDTGRNSSSSLNQNDDTYEVEKIVNQRMINGKRQYKVIWAGYAFQEATWEPEEHLNCPDKIAQFLKRYQDVIKRKMATSTSNNQQISHSTPKYNQQPNRNTVSPNKMSMVNHQKLQQSLKKNEPQVKSINDISSLKKTIMKPQEAKHGLNVVTNSQQKKPQSLNKNQMSSSNVANKITIPSVPGSSKQLTTVPNNSNKPQPAGLNVVKISNPISQSKPNSSTNEKQPTLNTVPSRSKQTLQKIQHDPPAQDEEQSNERVSRRPATRKTSDYPSSKQKSTNNNNSGSDSQQNGAYSSSDNQTKQQFSKIWLNIQQRLQVQKIIGFLWAHELNTLSNSSNNQENKSTLFDQPKQMYFIVKNKFSDQQKIVSRQRLDRQQPRKLAQYYQSIMMQM